MHVRKSNNIFPFLFFISENEVVQAAEVAIFVPVGIAILGLLAGLTVFGVYRRRKQKNEKNLDAFEMDVAMANVGE